MGSSILSKSAILYIVEVRENIDKVTQLLQRLQKDLH